MWDSFEKGSNMENIVWPILSLPTQNWPLGNESKLRTVFFAHVSAVLISLWCATEIPSLSNSGWCLWGCGFGTRELRSDSHGIFKVSFSWDQIQVLSVFLFNWCDDININPSLNVDDGLLLMGKRGREKEVFVFLKLLGWHDYKYNLNNAVPLVPYGVRLWGTILLTVGLFQTSYKQYRSSIFVQGLFLTNKKGQLLDSTWLEGKGHTDQASNPGTPIC